MQPQRDAVNLDPGEIAKFAAIADAWWAPDGLFAPLHAMAPARLGYLRDAITAHFGLKGGGLKPLAGLRLLDAGCGGGLVSEPMARLGATVTGLDAGEETLKAALAHAAAQGLAITYRQGTVEALAEAAPAAFDVVLALEIVEHVPDMAGFVRACATLVRPGGLVIVSTINRTLAARALALFAAEKLLKWAPDGAHDFDRLVRPDELAHALRAAGLIPDAPQGLSFNPLARTWARSGDVSINYLLSASKP